MSLLAWHYQHVYRLNRMVKPSDIIINADLAFLHGRVSRWLHVADVDPKSTTLIIDGESDVPACAGRFNMTYTNSVNQGLPTHDDAARQ